MSEENKAAEAEATGLYSKVEPLRADRHGDLRLKPAQDMSFARSLNSILLMTTEFPSAALNYPIVFAKLAEGVMPFVVTGYKQGENIYVGEDGQWRENFYIPAFVRRYPFIFMENKEQNNLALCIDAACEGLGEEEGDPLYEEGKPAALTNRALNFAKAYHTEAQKSSAIVKQIEEAGLLVERNAQFTLPDGEKTVVSGFSVVDEQKLNELDDEAFIALRKSGALAAIYCHLMSMRAWGNVLG